MTGGRRIWLPLVLLLGSGCAPRAARPVDPAAVAAASNLTSTSDRARLEAIARARASLPADSGYRIGPDDLLQVRIPDVTDTAPVGALAPPSTVSGQPLFMNGQRVGADGMITVQMLGTVRAEGLTAGELEAELGRQLRDRGILRDPQVSVMVVEFRSRVVAVVGSVERPGLYPLTRPRATLADLVWAAGGPSKEAGRIVEFAAVTAPPDESASTPPAGRIARVATRLGAADGLAVEDVRIEPAGRGRRLVLTLTEPASAQTFALADPARIVVDLRGAAPPALGAPPQRFALDDDVVTTVRVAARADTLRAVLDLPGGPIPHSARTEGTAVVVELGETSSVPPPATATPRASRIDPSPGVPIRLDLDALLHAKGASAPIDNPEVRPGDVISLAPAGTVQVDGWVAKPGQYPISRGLTMSGAVAAAGGRLFPADREHAVLRRVIAPGDERYYEIDLAAVADGRMPDLPVVDGDVVRLPTSVPRLVPWAAWNAVSMLFNVGTSLVLF